MYMELSARKGDLGFFLRRLPSGWGSSAMAARTESSSACFFRVSALGLFGDAALASAPSRAAESAALDALEAAESLAGSLTGSFAASFRVLFASSAESLAMAAPTAAEALALRSRSVESFLAMAVFSESARARESVRRLSAL